MRLLDARRLELVDIRDDAIPPYAILSHTWGDEEITLQELQHMKGRMPQSLDKRKRTIADKKGFTKVKEVASLAVSRGYSYIWIDTCCIDKSSSAELSEAINSMYLWYQQSEECYAFLSDVRSAKEEDWSMPNSSFRGSRWFTRGWTLQELIAPKSVHFYARDWSLLGHKDGPDTFTKIISEVTGIDREVLDGRSDPLQLSVAARMKWASHRHTTRLEDTAYSLMGLFQVNMPLLYGEGHRAFTRLQEEIIQRSEDQSLYAWNSFDKAEEDPDALSGLLARSPEQFQDTGNIQPLPPSPVHASAPSGMTNHGLRVQLYLRPILEEDGVPMEEDYYAILDCFIPVGNLYQCPVIRLRRLSQDQYARLQTKSRKLLPPSQSEFSEYEEYRTIYVRQQPVYYNLPQFRVSPLHMNSGFHNRDRQDFELTEIFPPRQWNSSTMTMKVEYSRKLQAMGVFRFQNPISHDKKVDIVVGLRRLDPMRWEGWAVQRVSRDSLESTLSVVNQKVAELSRTKQSVISSEMLRDSLGDDSQLMSDATVEGIQLQGRLYISISMSLKPEIQTTTGIRSILKQKGFKFPTKQSLITIPLLRDFQIRTLTGSCSRSYMTRSILLDEAGSIMEPLAVRGRPPRSSGLGASAEEFIKPLHDYLESIKAEKATAEPDSSANFSEELALALFEGNRTEIKRLLTMGTSLDLYTSDLYGFGPLHWAVAGGSIESIRMLLQKGVSPLSVTREGWTAMHVSALLKKSAWRAISVHDHIRKNLDEFANKRTKYHLDTALHLAAAYSPDSEHGRSFFWELSNDVLSYSPLFSRNRHDETPLHRAAAFNNIGTIQSIVHQRTQVRHDFIDVVDRYGRTPLWHAAAAGSCEAIQTLLSLGASINLTDDLGRSPLHAACRGGYHEAVELLLQNEACQSTQTSTLNLTALDYASMFGHAECLRHLLTLRSLTHALFLTEPETLSSQNKALHIAASCGWLKCVEILCQSGADPFMTRDYYLKLDDSKKYAIMVEKEGDAQSAAGREDHVEIVRYFEMSDTCKAHRYRKQFGTDMPISTSPVSDSNVPQTPYPAAGDRSNTEIIDYGYPENAYPVQQLPQAIGSTPYDIQTRSDGYAASVPLRYTPGVESYGDSMIVPPLAPFAEQPSSKIGRQSATLPAYTSPAYQQLTNESTDIYQYQPPQTALYPRRTLGQTPYAYNLRQNSLPYRPPNPSRPQSYAAIASVPASRPFSLPASSRYPLAPTSQNPVPYNPYDEPFPPPVPPLPQLPTATTQENSQLSIVDAKNLLANLVRMLGKLGTPDMLIIGGPPTDPELLQYDAFMNGPVYQRRGTQESTTVDSNGLPVFEVGTD